MNKRVKDGLFTVFFMFAVTFVCMSAVSAVNLLTRDTVARNESLFMKRAVMEAAGQPVSVEAQAVHDWYAARVRTAAGRPGALEVVDPETGLASARVYVRSGPGLWGEILAVIGLDAGPGNILGVTFVKHNETPGLGARIDETWFKEQFRGKTGPFRLAPEGTRSESPGEIDAITGATVTSTAVRELLNRLQAEVEATGSGEDT